MSWTVSKSRKNWFRPICGNKFLISTESFLHSTIVSNVFTLCVDTIYVNLLITNINGIVAVLIDDALSLLQIFLLGLGLPPVNKITLRVIIEIK